MGKPYSEDLRERVIGAAQDGATIPEIAEQFGVSISSVVRFRRLHRETGSVSPAKVRRVQGICFGGSRGVGQGIGGGAVGYHAGRTQGRPGDGEGHGRSVVDLAISAPFKFALQKKACV